MDSSIIEKIISKWWRGVSDTYRRQYVNGWRASARDEGGSLDRADQRNAPHAWYDGYMDRAVNREKYHTLHCTGCAVEHYELDPVTN